MEEIPLARALGVPADAIAAAHAIARGLLRGGESGRAKTIWAGCLALDPGDREAAAALAELALEARDPRAALAAIARARGPIEIEILAARAHIARGALEEARAALAPVAARDPAARALLARIAAR